MRFKWPWIDVKKCDVEETCSECKASKFCRSGSFQVISDNGKCQVAIDFEKCKRCGECAHACDRGAVKMV